MGGLFEEITKDTLELTINERIILFIRNLVENIKKQLYNYENTLAEAKMTALSELKERAQQLGANAVVGIDFDYETIGQSASMLLVACSGTAVTIDE